MKHNYMKILLICCAIFFSIAASSDVLWSASDNKSVQEKPQEKTQVSTEDRLNRIDFGNSYIIGQTIKSGAVYLLQRKKSEIKSMLKYREDYRKEILEDISIEDLNVSAKEQKNLIIK